MSLRKLCLAVSVFAFATQASGGCGHWHGWNQKWLATDARAFAAADLDGDQIPEILSTSASTLAYRRASNFSPVPLYVGTSLGTPVAADVNGDTKIDLLVPDAATNVVIVLPGNGDATFGTPITTNLPVSPARILVGNFTGDANRDIAVLGNDGSIRILQGNGSGTFSAVGTLSLGTAAFDATAGNFDGDAYDDLAVSYAAGSGVDVFFSTGGGAFAAPVAITDGTSSHIIAGDFDADGDPDLLIEKSAINRLTMAMSRGDRTFSVTTRNTGFMDPATSITVGDFDGVGGVDVYVAAPRSLVPVYLSGQNWEVSGASLVPLDRNLSRPSVAAGDFDGDGLQDVVVASPDDGSAVLMLAQCGPLSPGLGLVSILTVGQPVFASVSIYATAPAPAPTGTATLNWLGHEVTLNLQSYFGQGYSVGFAEYEVPGGLPIGFHEMTMHYSGDGNYSPTDATSYIRITSETTTTTLTGPSEWVYGTRPWFTATATSSTGITPGGTFSFYLDDANRTSVAASDGTWRVPSTPAGTHVVKVGLFNWFGHPPSNYVTQQVTVTKATLSLSLLYGLISRNGAPAKIYPELTSAIPFGPSGSGSLKLMEGATTLATGSLPIVSAMTVNGLSEGTHHLRVVYDGDSNTEPASLAFDHIVLPASTVFPLVASGFDTSVKLDTLLPAGSSTNTVYRRTSSSGWTAIGTIYNPYFIDSSAVPGTAYQYRIQVVPTGGGSAIDSNVEVAYAGAFTDTDLTAKPVKQVHFAELQNAVNAIRAFAGLSPLALNFTGFIRESDVTQLRSAINAARSNLGLAPVAFTDTLVPGTTPIRAIHLQQIRDAVR